MSVKMTPAGIEPATFRFVAQHHNHCATTVPHITSATHLCGKESRVPLRTANVKKANLEGIYIAIFFRFEGSSLTIKEGRELHISVGIVTLNL